VKTWGQDVDYVFISDHEDPSKKIMKFSNNPNYDSGQEKQIKSANYFSTIDLDYDFVFFCDNDCFVNTRKLSEFVQTCDTNCVWGELCKCWKPEPTLNYTLGGSGILLSKSIMKQINGKLKEHHIQYGDVSLGLNLRDMGIEMRHYDFFKSQPHTFYNLSLDDVKNYITFHYIKDFQTMNQYYELCRI
jgi:hypothetical protein